MYQNGAIIAERAIKSTDYSREGYKKVVIIAFGAGGYHELPAPPAECNTPRRMIRGRSAEARGRYGTRLGSYSREVCQRVAIIAERCIIMVRL